MTAYILRASWMKKKVSEEKDLLIKQTDILIVVVDSLFWQLEPVKGQ